MSLFEGNTHHKAADSNQAMLQKELKAMGEVPIAIAQTATGIEALLAIDQNLGRIADALEAMISGQRRRSHDGAL